MTIARGVWLLATAVLLLPFIDMLWRVARQSWVERAFRARIVLLVLEVAAVVGWFLVQGRWRFVPDPSAWVALGAALVALIGAAFSAWAKLRLGRLFSYHLGVQRDHELITDGPYAIVRHPMYFGIILYIFGSAFYANDAALLILAFLFGFFFTFQLRQEEAIFERHFGEPYQQYRARTPALIPLPWKR